MNVSKSYSISEISIMTFIQMVSYTIQHIQSVALVHENENSV